MRKGIFVFMICCCQYVFCQNTWERDSLMYMAAYKYIVNDSINKNKLVVVADSIFDLDRIFMKELEQFPEEYKKLCHQREQQMKRYFTKFTYYSPLLASLFRNQDVKRSTNILFFSDIIDLMLRADINFFDKQYMKEDNKFQYEAYMWGISYEYLFIFNEDCTIRKVLCHPLMLN